MVPFPPLHLSNVANHVSSTDAGTLDSIVTTAELDERPSRAADYRAENRAFAHLARTLANAPDTILQELVETIKEILDVGSAGISLLSEDEQFFEWPAIAGEWQIHIGGANPRDFSPCGVVFDRRATQMMSRVEEYYPYFAPVVPKVEECLLAPFEVGGKLVGTVWAVAHVPDRKFDREDMRRLESLAGFAASAYQVTTTLELLRERERELRDADRKKNEFMASLAHELRNPLAPIANAVAILRLANTGNEYVDSASEMMERQVGQMSRLIDDLLDVSRVSRGAIELQLAEVDLESLISQVVESTAHAIQGKGIKLTVHLPTEEVIVNGDRSRLLQVLTNLLNNAIKFTDPGGVVTIGAAHVDGVAEIDVTDSGVGISPDEIGNVFEMFHQVGSSLERNHSGLGIGLALVKRLVELHGGSVSVQSDGLGDGSTFTVRVPTVLKTN
ncbi:GAF domain-containing sensor histidine kinase [Lacipirellula sp.]|uniref:GAF domain-containing sensor histidine kinase n=1 Tax=Lacipirellula sp. TaxID=2691419 RepID=UPI003D11EF06